MFEWTRAILSSTLLSFARILEWGVIVNNSDLFSRDIVLDVACGDGSWDWFLNKNFKSRFIGLDSDRDSLVKAKTINRGSVDFVLGDAQRLPFKDNSFDVVLSSSAIEHFNDVDVAVGEIWRILRKRGRLTLSTDSIISSSIKHAVKYDVIRYYDRYKIGSLLGDNGFSLLYFDEAIRSRLAKLLHKALSRTNKNSFTEKLIFLLGFLLLPILGLLDGNKASAGYSIIVEAIKLDSAERQSYGVS